MPRRVIGYFGDDRFDHNLRATDVKLTDNLGQHALGLRVGGDDERVRLAKSGDAGAADRASDRAARRIGGSIGLARNDGPAAWLAARHQFLQNREDRFGLGVVQPHNADVRARLRAGVEVFDQPGVFVDCGGLAPHQNGVGAFDGYQAHFRRAAGALGAFDIEQAFDNAGDLARAGIGKRNRARLRAINVQLGNQAAQAFHIVGVIGNDDQVRAGARQDHAASPDKGAQALGDRGRIDLVEPNDVGDEWTGIAGGARLGRNAFLGLDEITAAGDRHGDQLIGAQGGQEHLEQFAIAERAIAEQCHRTLHARIDDDGAPGLAGDIGDEGANVGVLGLQRLGVGLLGERHAGRGGARGPERGHCKADMIGFGFTHFPSR